MIDGKTIHRTSTGKIFQCQDLDGNPVEYAKYKHIFNRYVIAQLDVGQTLRSLQNQVMLKRLK